MTLVASYRFGASEVLAARLDSGDEAVREATARLSLGERQRTARFASERDRRRFVVARS